MDREEEKYKRFVIFGCYQYYPGGGLNDVVGEADTLEEARAFLGTEKIKGYDWHNILDLQERVECDLK